MTTTTTGNAPEFDALIAREAKETKMFGATINDMRAFVKKYIGPGELFPDRATAAISILSDCQEQIGMGLHERARQGINRAKWLIDPKGKFE